MTTYEQLKYLFYCAEVEINPQLDSSRKSYGEALRLSTKHSGDCTKKPHTCIRCMLNDIEIQAQNAIEWMEEEAKCAGSFKELKS